MCAYGLFDCGVVSDWGSLFCVHLLSLSVFVCCLIARLRSSGFVVFVAVCLMIVILCV